MIEIKKVLPVAGIYLFIYLFISWLLNVKLVALFGNIFEGSIFLGLLFLFVFIHSFLLKDLKEKIVILIIDLIPWLIFVIYASLDADSFVIRFLMIFYFFLLPLIVIIILNLILVRIWNVIKNSRMNKK